VISERFKRKIVLLVKIICRKKIEFFFLLCEIIWGFDSKIESSLLSDTFHINTALKEVKLDRSQDNLFIVGLTCKKKIKFSSV